MKLFDATLVPLQGVHLIEASAGTGKTYNITSLYIRALMEKKLLPSQILVVTYTKDATAELKARIRSRMLECIEVAEGQDSSDPFLVWFKKSTTPEQIQHLKKALHLFDEAVISTIHGFCQNLLSDYSLDFGVSPGFEVLSDETEIITDASDESWRQFFSPTNNVLNSSIRDYLQRTFSAPDKLLEKVGAAVAQPEMKLNPATQELREFESIHKQFQEAAQTLTNIFNDEKKELASLLTPDSLNKGTYFHGGNYDRPAELYAWISSGECFKNQYEKLDKFTPFEIDKGLKNGFERPEHLRFFTAVEHWLMAFIAFEQIKVAFLHHSISSIRKRIWEFKEQHNALGYNDLLNVAKQGITRSKSLAHLIKTRFPIALVDEFQDTDHVQFALFSALYEASTNTALFLIGDPKQAIYRFRGADINTYLLAKNEVLNYNQHTLVYNYRSSAKVLAGINAFFNHSETPFNLTGFGFDNARYPETEALEKGRYFLNGEELAPVQCLELKSELKKKGYLERQAIQSTASEVVKLLSKTFDIEGKKIEADDIAILVSTHAQASEMQQKLMSVGVRSQIRSKQSVFTSLQASELYSVLQAVANPFNQQLVRAALGTHLMGFSIAQLQELKSNETNWNSIQHQFTQLHTVWNNQGFVKCISMWLNNFEIEAELLKKPNALRSITNLNHIIELLTKEAQSGKVTQYHILNHFKAKLDLHESTNIDEEFIRLESDDHLVRIMTMHASKGLEFPVVFCPFLWMHSSKSDEYFAVSDGIHLSMELDKTSDTYKEQKLKKAEEEFSEQLRLAYVALTRASSVCFVHWTQENILWNKNPLLHLIVQNKTKESVDSTALIWRDAEIDEVLLPISTISTKQVYKVQEFGRSNLFDFPRMHSFSSLASNTSVFENEEKPGFDLDYTAVDDRISTFKEESIFTLPKGKVTGNLMHELFENIEFDDPTTFEPTIESVVEKHGFESRWKPILSQLVSDGVAHILKDGISLNQITNENRLVEMQFYFPMKRVDTAGLISIIRGSHQSATEENSGFMTGFIDLIFRYKGKYYILDYKSNHLGDSTLDYTTERLNEEMLHSNYDLQYHIYTVALYRFLKERVPDFDYTRDFGGVFYYFLRGINRVEGGSGIYFDRPEFVLIQSINKYMEGVRHE